MRGPNKCLQPWQIAREKIRRRIREANGEIFYLAPTMRIEIDCKAHLVETGPIARRLGAKMDSLNYWRVTDEAVLPDPDRKN